MASDYHRKEVTDILKYFSYMHLPVPLQATSKMFCDVAYQVANLAPESSETTVCLRKLLEGKDAGVRAVMDTEWYKQSMASAEESIND